VLLHNLIYHYYLASFMLIFYNIHIYYIRYNYATLILLRVHFIIISRYIIKHDVRHINYVILHSYYIHYDGFLLLPCNRKLGRNYTHDYTILCHTIIRYCYIILLLYFLRHIRTISHYASFNILHSHIFHHYKLLY